MFGRQFGINYPSTFLKILKFSKQNEGNFKILKSYEKIAQNLV